MRFSKMLKIREIRKAKRSYKLPLISLKITWSTGCKNSHWRRNTSSRTNTVQLNALINKLRDPNSRTFTRGHIMPLSTGSPTSRNRKRTCKIKERARFSLVNSVAHANHQKAKHSSIRFAQRARLDFIAVPIAKEQTGKMGIKACARNMWPKNNRKRLIESRTRRIEDKYI